jgi:hypothetical protein
MDGDQDDVVFAQAPAEFVYPAAAFGQGNVLLLRNEELGIEVKSLKTLDNPAGDEPVVGILAKPSIGTPFAWSFTAVAVID